MIGIVLVGLMILSTGGYAIMNNESESSSTFIKYNGIKFYNNGGYWQFTYNNQQFITEYNPNQISEINAPVSKKITSYSNKVLYFVTESGEPNNEVYRNLYGVIKKWNGACLSEDCKLNLPVKSCDTDEIIIIKEPLANETEGIIQDKNCIFIRANSNNQTKYIDAFLFKIIGI